MNTSFFGPKGLTTTSASYLANLAQEQIKSDETWFNQLRFFGETMTLLSTGVECKSATPTVKDLSIINATIKRDANLYWFIAYVKEAIKAKEQAVDRLPDFSVWAQDKLEPSPDSPNTVSEEDIVAEFDSSKLAKYLRLQQFAALYGKLIHNRGDIASARKTAYTVANNPTHVENLATDVVIKKNELAFSLGEIDEVFNQLQATRREYDKELNKMKFEILEEVNRRNQELGFQYREAYSAWKDKRIKLQSEYRSWYTQKVEEIQTTWKIVIPEELQSTLRYLQSLGKVDE